MTLAAFRDSIVSTIGSEISAFKDVRAFGGRFNRTELQRISTNQPAALVALLGGPLVRQGGTQPRVNVTVAVFIVTRGTSQEPRDEAVMTLVEAVAGLVVRDAWDYEDASAPQSMKIDNMYTGMLDNLGVAIWAVTWVQGLDIANFSISDYANLHSVYADYDLAPSDGVFELQQVINLWGSLMSAYGHIYVSAAAATSVLVADTYYKAAGTTTLKLALDCDMPANGRVRHTGSAAKVFLCTAEMSATVGADTKVTAAFAKNGVVDEDTAIEQEVTIAGGAETISLSGSFSLAENDYVEVWLTAGDITTVTLTKLNLGTIAT